MSGGLLVFSEDLTKYDFGSDHPMAPGRVTNTISLARQLGVLDRLRIVPPPNIDLALLETIHTSDYIAAVQRGEPNQRYGLGTSDNPVFPGMHEIAAWVTMASVEAARRVWTRDAQRASNIGGGLMNAKRNSQRARTLAFLCSAVCLIEFPRCRLSRKKEAPN